MIDWIDVRFKMPIGVENKVLLTTDGINVGIHEYEFGYFTPIRLVRGDTIHFMPKYWYNLNDVKLPEGE